MQIHQAYDDVHQQYREPVKKIRATAWRWVTCLWKRIPARAIANLPYKVKGFENGIVTKFTVLIYHSYGNVYQQFCKPVKKVRATAWWSVTCLCKGISARAIANLKYHVKGFDCSRGFHFKWYRHQIFHTRWWDMIPHVASVLNGIATKFTVHIYHSNGNVYQQFCKPVKKVRATAWWWVTCLCKGISGRAIENLQYHVKGFDCSCGFHCEWYRHQIWHAHSACQGNLHQKFGEPV